MKNNKGFTLIELLAVIVILGVLMIVAIPAMTRYIENSKRDVFADTAKKYISSARYSLISDGFLYKPDATKNEEAIVNLNDIGTSGIYISTKYIKLENGTNKSPWGKGYDADWGCIKVTQGSDGKYEYAFAGMDNGRNGIGGGSTYISETALSRSSVVKKTASAPTCGGSGIVVTGINGN